jgi:hypothetical protein
MTTLPSPDSSSSACEAFELRLNEVLDERLDPSADTQLAGHVEACESCRRRLRMSSRLLASFRSQSPGDLKPSLSHQWARRIADQHAQELQVQPGAASKNQKKRRRVRPSAWFLLLSTSAAAVAIAVTLQITLNRRSESVNKIAANNGAENKAKSSFSGTKSSASNSTLALSHAGPPTWAEYQETFKAWETAIDPEGTGRESIESSVEPLADSFRPVGHSFSTVIGGLRKTQPASRARRPKSDDGALNFWERWSVV